MKQLRSEYIAEKLRALVVSQDIVHYNSFNPLFQSVDDAHDISEHGW